MRHIVLVVFLLLVIMTVSAQEEDIIGPFEYPEGVNPLTGLVVDDPAVLNRRPLIIKISNFPPLVRPQSGLNDADMVWEHLLSGGITRYSAIFLSKDLEKVGPVRSARLVDMELIRIYRGLFSYSGMAQGTIEIMNKDALVPTRAIGAAACPVFCRFEEEGLALEHTLYGNTAEIRTEAERRNRDTTPEPVYGMAFREAPPEGGTPVNGVTINYRETDSGWTYDAERGRWLHSQDGEAHFDALTDDRVNAANVLILEDEHVIQPFVQDQYWGPDNFAFYVNFIGTGRVYLFRDGLYYEGIWQRDEQSGVLTYYDLQGNVLPFKPGNTFVNLVPRWVDGYQLTFFPSDPATATVNGTTGASLRTGPGDAYGSLDVSYPGDTFDAIGRNRSSDWVQVYREDIGMFWLPLARVEVDPIAYQALPVTRPTSER